MGSNPEEVGEEVKWGGEEGMLFEISVESEGELINSEEAIVGDDEGDDIDDGDDDDDDDNVGEGSTLISSPQSRFG